MSDASAIGRSFAWLRRVRTLLSVSSAYMLEYRAEIFLWGLTGALPLILMGVWIKAAENGAYNMTSAELARYFLAVFLVRQFTAVWVIWDFETDVVEGRLSPYLLQPIDPVWRYMSMHLAERAVRAPAMALLVFVFAVAYPWIRWWPSWTNLGWFLLAATLAYLLRFALQYTFAMMAFWTERASAIEQVWYLPYLFLSGMMAPLDLYPAGVREFAYYTPFPYLVYFPANLLTGRPVDIAQGMWVMTAWTAVLIILNRVMWRLGLRKYSGQGA